MSVPAVFRPPDWAAAATLKSEYPGATVLAGGTALQPLFNSAALRPTTVLTLGGISPVAVSRQDGVTRFDALTTVSAAFADPHLAGLFPSRLGWFATPAVRRRATVVGNLLAAVGGRRDLAVLILLADGHLITRSSTNAHEIGLDQVLRQGLAQDEVVTGLRVLVPQRLHYARVAVRATSAPATAAIAAGLTSAGTRVVIRIGNGIPSLVPVAAAHLTQSGAGAEFTEAVEAAAGEFARRPLGVLAARCYRAFHE
jgi:CO/xanthine dehydrogenase FAD-binding subunit